MPSKFRLFTKRLFIYLNILVVIFFLLSCLIPFLNPAKWWFISMLGLAFPFLLLFVILFFLGWLVMKPKLSLISLGALILGLKSILVFVAFNKGHEFNYTKEPGTIRIVSWNVARFVEMKRNLNEGSRTRLRMMELIQQQDADVLCLQEFFHSFDPTYYPNIDYIRKNFKYPYWYYSHDVDGDKHFTGTIIFSRFPIVDSGMIRYPRPTSSNVINR